MRSFRQLLKATRGPKDQVLECLYNYRNIMEDKITALTTLNEINKEAMKEAVNKLPGHNPAIPPISETPQPAVAFSPPIFPATPVKTLAEREDFLESLRKFRPHIDKLDSITPADAMTFLVNRRTRISGMGCWECDKRGYRHGKKKAIADGRIAPSDTRGYLQAEIRSVSKDPDGDRAQTYFHHLAVVARGGLSELRAALKARQGDDSLQWFEASHLCHNDGCFNPDHVVVEPRLENRQRQGCKYLHIIVHGDFVYHPCPHGWNSVKKKCLMPTKTFDREVEGCFGADPAEIWSSLVDQIDS